MTVNRVAPGVRLKQWTRVLFSGLHAAGVRDVVTSPGSRSTPLVLGALQTEGLRCHSIADERAAGFFALGLAKTSGKPVLLVCTSGSAGAHYLPAVIEAHESEVPLLILTADRPAELQDVGAPQTIEQTGMFGCFAKRGPLLGEPSEEPDPLAALLRKSVQAVLLSQSPTRGPVHLNFPVAKPLEPKDPSCEADEAHVRAVSKLLLRGAPVMTYAGTGAASDLHAFLAPLHATGRLLVTIGPVPQTEAHAARLLADALGAPCLSELSQAGPSAPLEFLAPDLAKGPLAPEIVLHIGPPVVSGAWSRALKENQFSQYLLPGCRLRDPSNRAARVLLGDLTELLPTLLQAAQTGHPSLRDDSRDQPAERSRFRQFWQSRMQHCHEIVNQALSDMSTPLGGVDAALGEVSAARAALCAAPERSTVLIANSLSLRAASWSMQATRAALYTSRGANGIDGWLAQAQGVRAASQAPTLLLVGDVAALHDLTSLSLLPASETPLVVCIVDNQGGRIFDSLPIAAELNDVPERMKFWTTPPRVDFSLAAAAFSAHYSEASSEEALTRLLVQRLGTSGTSVVVARITEGVTAQFLRDVRSRLIS